MNSIIGIVPGAGRASRIGGFFKELTPININKSDPLKFVVVAEQIIRNLQSAGASPIYFVLNAEKVIISEYFSKSNIFTSKVRYIYQSNLDKYYGMPFAVDEMFEESRGKTVLMGMPDTLIEPDDAFQILLKNFHSHQSDLELGLFPTGHGNHGGYIEFDPSTARVTSHVDKTSPSFPVDRANNAWAIACWNSRFTDFLHVFVERKRKEQQCGGAGQPKELLFGDIVDAAISSAEIRVCADFISNGGYYLDITNPEKYFQAVLHYHGGRPVTEFGHWPHLQFTFRSVFERFHMVADVLRLRRGERLPLKMDDEYDVQYLMHALLQIVSEDVRAEEGSSSHAGSSSRMDFLLKREQIVIEVKRVRKGLGQKEIGNQLILDIDRYKANIDCRRLICFIYDPERLLRNPTGLERDLTKQYSGLPVTVVVVPKGK